MVCLVRNFFNILIGFYSKLGNPHQTRIKPGFKYSNAMIISIIININFHNTNHYTQLFIQSNHFLPLKDIFFQSQKFNTNHYTQLFIQSNHFQSLPTIKKIIFSNLKNLTLKHKFKKNLNSIQHPNTFSLPRNPQTDSKYYLYSKNQTPK
jgi:hypothetical protein